jgi:hypothetical protein
MSATDYWEILPVYVPVTVRIAAWNAAGAGPYSESSEPIWVRYMGFHRYWQAKS